MLVRLNEVHFGYRPQAPVISGVSGALAPGVCALIGPNAAGKSTLLKLMLGQLAPQRGTVTLEGLPVSSMPPMERARRVAYVPQRALMETAFTVEEVVALGRYAAVPDATVVEEAMAMCDLTSLHGRIVSQLSMGQQQGVALARAIAQLSGAADRGGRFLLLDEPVSAMDLWHAHHTMSLLRDLASKGLSVVVVLHDLNLAATYADVVWLMEGGRLASHGAWETVLQPAVLEPVYRMHLRMERIEGKERPFFVAG